MSSARQHVLFSKISKMKNYGDVLVSLILLSAKKNERKKGFFFCRHLVPLICIRAKKEEKKL